MTDDTKGVACVRGQRVRATVSYHPDIDSGTTVEGTVARAVNGDPANYRRGKVEVRLDDGELVWGTTLEVIPPQRPDLDDDASVFLRVEAGQLPGEVVWRDDHCFAMLVNRPLNDGHVVVCPWDQVGDWEDLDDDTLAGIHVAAARLARAMRAAWNPPHVASVWAGFDIPTHAHLHVFPAYRDVDIDWLHIPRLVEPTDLAEPADRLRSALADLDRSGRSR